MRSVKWCQTDTQIYTQYIKLYLKIYIIRCKLKIFVTVTRDDIENKYFIILFVQIDLLIV